MTMRSTVLFFDYQLINKILRVKSRKLRKLPWKLRVHERMLRINETLRKREEMLRIKARKLCKNQIVPKSINEKE